MPADLDLSDKSPVEQVGDPFVIGWAGLYEDLPFPGWFLIRVLNRDGSEKQTIHTADEALFKWGIVKAALQEDTTEPAPDDYVIGRNADNVYQVYPSGEKFGFYTQALDHIRDRMAEDGQVHGDVTLWLIDDSGNFQNATDDLRKDD